jgi:hypothetical protein
VSLPGADNEIGSDCFSPMRTVKLSYRMLQCCRIPKSPRNRIFSRQRYIQGLQNVALSQVLEKVVSGGYRVSAVCGLMQDLFEFALIQICIVLHPSDPL